MTNSMATDRHIKTFLINSIDASGYDAEPQTVAERIAFLHDTFNSEHGYYVERIGQQAAVALWLSGLPSALPIPCYYGDIIALAVETGGLVADHTGKQADEIYQNYFNFMAAKVCQLFNGCRVPTMEATQ